MGKRTMSIHIPGWPSIVIDTPEERERQKVALANAKAKMPMLFETEIDGRIYRLRGYLSDGETSGSVCEWLYNGTWKEVLNYMIIDEIKERFYQSTTNKTPGTIIE